MSVELSPTTDGIVTLQEALKKDLDTSELERIHNLTSPERLTEISRDFDDIQIIHKIQIYQDTPIPVTSRKLTDAIGATKGLPKEKRLYTRITDKKELDEIKDQYGLTNLLTKDVKIYRPHQQKHPPFVLMAHWDESEITFYLCPIQSDVAIRLALKQLLDQKIKNAKKRIPEQIFPPDPDDQLNLTPRLREFVERNPEFFRTAQAEAILESGLSIHENLKQRLLHGSNPSTPFVANGKEFMYFDEEDKYKFIWLITPYISDQSTSEFRISICGDPECPDHAKIRRRQMMESFKFAKNSHSDSNS